MLWLALIREYNFLSEPLQPLQWGSTCNDFKRRKGVQLDEFRQIWQITTSG